mgnify:CR=1 FL=1
MNVSKQLEIVVVETCANLVLHSSVTLSFSSGSIVLDLLIDI